MQQRDRENDQWDVSKRVEGEPAAKGLSDISAAYQATRSRPVSVFINDTNNGKNTCRAALVKHWDLENKPYASQRFSGTSVVLQWQHCTALFSICATVFGYFKT